MSVGAALIFFFISAAPTNAQTICTERKAAVAKLEKDYSEVPVSMGLASNGAVIEVLASPDSPEGNTFTIILTRPDGISCVMAAGEAWENLPKKLAGSKDPET